MFFVNVIFDARLKRVIKKIVWGSCIILARARYVGWRIGLVNHWGYGSINNKIKKDVAKSTMLVKKHYVGIYRGNSEFLNECCKKNLKILKIDIEYLKSLWYKRSRLFEEVKTKNKSKESVPFFL